MKNLIYMILFCVTIGGCQSDETVAPQDLFGVYEGRASGLDTPIPPTGAGNCTGDGLKIDDKGNNEVYIFAGCNINTNYATNPIPRFDNLRIGKTTIDTVRVTDFRYGPYTLKNVTHGLFNKMSGKQVGYIAYEKIVTAPAPPRRIIQTYYLYIPFIISSNTKDTLTHYFGRRILKEINE